MPIQGIGLRQYTARILNDEIARIDEAIGQLQAVKTVLGNVAAHNTPARRPIAAGEPVDFDAWRAAQVARAAE